MYWLNKVATFIKNFTMVAFGLLNVCLGVLFWYLGADVWLFWQNLPSIDLKSSDGFISTTTNIFLLGGLVFTALPFLEKRFKT